MQLQPNTTFANRYQLERLLGRGGFSEVWLAKDSYTKLEIAIKVYAPGQGMDTDGLQEFSQELAGVFNLNQTNLLKPTHVDSWENMPYLIMPYCAQGSLTKQVGKMSEQEIWHLIHDVAAGLAYLHKNDIVHQDIKPDNILLDSTNNYVITDFGISTKARSTLRKSVIGGALSGGTMAYMGPERFSRQPAPTKASDIWSFGTMVFELITGNVPFGEMGGGLQKGGAEIPEITENVSAALKGIIEQMLAKETWDRPTAEKLIEIASLQLQSPTMQDVPHTDIPTAENATSIASVKETTYRPTMPFTSPATPVFSVTPEEIQFPAEGGEERKSAITIKSEDVWSAKISTAAKDWLHIRKRQNSEDTIYVWADKNKTGDTRYGYIYVTSGNAQNSVHIQQPSLPKSKAWIGWLIAICVLIIAVPVGGSVHEQKIQEISWRHTDAMNEFDNYIGRANIDNINDLNKAYNSLQTIKELEDSRYFKETHQYATKKSDLKGKAQSLYNEVDKRYQIAPNGSSAKTRNKEKMQKITEIQKHL